jgi:hypothetical protein
MANDFSSPRVLLSACHELLEAYPESLRIQKQVEALEEAMPDHPRCGCFVLRLHN